MFVPVHGFFIYIYISVKCNIHFRSVDGLTQKFRVGTLSQATFRDALVDPSNWNESCYLLKRICDLPDHASTAIFPSKGSRTCSINGLITVVNNA